MEKYFAAKRLLFDGTVYPAPRVAVINAHDRACRRACPGRTRKAGAEIRTYGIGNGDWRAGIRLTPAGAEIHLRRLRAAPRLHRILPAK